MTNPVTKWHHRLDEWNESCDYIPYSLATALFVIVLGFAVFKAGISNANHDANIHYGYYDRPVAVRNSR